MPVPQENSSFVEWAGEPVLDKGGRFKVKQIDSVISCRVNKAHFRLRPSKI
ncbi:hypothetical protein [Microcoleus vaginatus]|uniref:hypothetical protein n=1 Tax=Microcoleus vaginatus TaxID=119532 RepID=UPI001F6066AD